MSAATASCACFDKLFTLISDSLSLSIHGFPGVSFLSVRADSLGPSP